MNPANQTATSHGSRYVKVGNATDGVWGEATCTAAFVNGWLISSTAKYKAGLTPSADWRRHARLLPIPTRKEKGIRNFRDAASQIQ